MRHKQVQISGPGSVNIQAGGDLFLKTIPGTRVDLGYDDVTFTDPDGTSRTVPYPESDDADS